MLRAGEPMTDRGTEVAFQPLRIEDAGLAHGLAKTVGFSTEPDIWRWMLGIGRGIAAHDRELGLVGTIVLLPYGSDVAMIAMMIVHAERQQRGIGKGLLSRALARGSFATHALYATAVGEKLYRPFGFVDQGESMRLEGKLASGGEPSFDPALRPMRDEDLPRVVSLDARAHGAPREALLRSLRHRVTSALVIDRGGDALAGFGFAARDQATRRIGPLVAERDEDAITLAAALSSGETVRIDCEPGETALSEWAIDRGLAPGELSPRLCRGRPLAGDRRMIRALAGRAFG